MSTRSDIIVHCADGKWARIYCHWDGYLAHNGRMLFDHYTSQRQADELVALGDLSILGEVIGVKHPFDPPSAYLGFGDAMKPNPAYDKFKKRYGKMCTAYGRDRGEKDTAADTGDSLSAVWPEAETWTEFTYVWDDGKWWAGDPDEGSQTLVDLGDLLMGKRTLKPKIKMFGGIILGQHKAHDPRKAV